MKDRVFSFLKKHCVLIISSVIFSLIYPIEIRTNYLEDALVSLTGLDGLKIPLLILFYILPIIHIIYGCVTYIVTKKVLIPIAIPTAIYFIVFTLNEWNCPLVEMILVVLALTLFPIFFAIIGIAIGAYIDYIVKYIIKVKKKKQN